jgi:hypothetical protein
VSNTVDAILFRLLANRGHCIFRFIHCIQQALRASGRIDLLNLRFRASYEIQPRAFGNARKGASELNFTAYAPQSAVNYSGGPRDQIRAKTPKG